MAWPLKKKKEIEQPFHLIALLKVVPQPGHLYRQMVMAFLPLGAIFQVFVGLATSILHFMHLANFLPPSLGEYRIS